MWERRESEGITGLEAAGLESEVRSRKVPREERKKKRSERDGVVPRLARDCVIYLYCYLARENVTSDGCAWMRWWKYENENKLTDNFSRSHAARACAETRRGERETGRRGEAPSCGDANRLPPPREGARNRESRRAETWNAIWRSARSDPGQNGGGWKARRGKPPPIDPRSARARSLSLARRPDSSRSCVASGQWHWNRKRYVTTRGKLARPLIAGRSRSR